MKKYFEAHKWYKANKGKMINFSFGRHGVYFRVGRLGYLTGTIIGTEFNHTLHTMERGISMSLTRILDRKNN